MGSRVSAQRISPTSNHLIIMNEIVVWVHHHRSSYDLRVGQDPPAHPREDRQSTTADPAQYHPHERG
jgi:hypothetical protein